MERRIRVFIADASHECVALLTAALAQEEDIVVVGSAFRGDEALRQFPESGADLLLTDLLLPGLDGLSLLRQLKQADALPHAIVLSGFFNDRIARSVSAVADNYLPKPCRAEELLRYMRECVYGGEESFFRDDSARITKALLDCGFMPHLDGYKYLRDGIARTVGDRSLLRGVTKALYRDIAKEFGTNPACVERSMRTAIEHAWQRKTPEERHRCFGTLFDAAEKAPSNVPFLSAMTEYVDSLCDERRGAGVF